MDRLQATPPAKEACWKMSKVKRSHGWLASAEWEERLLNCRDSLLIVSDLQGRWLQDGQNDFPLFFMELEDNFILLTSVLYNYRVSPGRDSLEKEESLLPHIHTESFVPLEGAV